MRPSTRIGSVPAATGAAVVAAVLEGAVTVTVVSADDAEELPVDDPDAACDVLEVTLPPQPEPSRIAASKAQKAAGAFDLES